MHILIVLHFALVLRFHHIFVFLLYNVAGVSAFSITSLCCPIMCHYVLGFLLWCPLRFSSLHLQLFVGGLMSCWRYLCLFTYSGVQHILWCVFLPLVWLPLRFISHVNGFKKLRSRQSKEDRQQNDKKQIGQKMIYKALHSKLNIE